EAERLVAARLGQDAQPPALDELDQPLAVAREAEEVVLLLDELGRGAVYRALAVCELVLCVEALAADAVEAPVGALVDVPGPLACLPELPHALGVAGLAAGADEVVEGERQRPAQRREGGGVAVDQRLRRQAL